MQTVPRQFINRTFDKEIIAKKADGPALRTFFTQLVGLERKHFDGAMRAVRQYITGLHRVSDN